MKLLVAYASKYGSTAEIADVIGDELQKRHYEVDVKSVDDVDSLAGYDGFVIGSALYAGGWMKPAAEFLLSNQDSLAGHPVWLFSSGPTGQGDVGFAPQQTAAGHVNGRQRCGTGGMHGHTRTF